MKMNEDKVEDFKEEFYGVIHKFNEKECYARLYSRTTNELVDDISFETNEFSIEDRKDLIENVIFYWDIGSVNGESYSIFKLKRIQPLSEEERIKKQKEINDMVEYFSKMWS